MTFKTRNDLPAKAREEMIALLNRQLADTFDLMSQVKQAHWNVKGPQFFPLHELFDKLAEGIELPASRPSSLSASAFNPAFLRAFALWASSISEPNCIEKNFFLNHPINQTIAIPAKRAMK